MSCFSLSSYAHNQKNTNFYSYKKITDKTKEFELSKCSSISFHDVNSIDKFINIPPEKQYKPTDLQKYEPDNECEGDELEKATFVKNYNQYKQNGYSTTYDEAIYTTMLDVNSLSEEQIKKAEKLSKEIEKCEVKGKSDDMDEEALFSAVIDSGRYKDTKPKKALKEKEAIDELHLNYDSKPVFVNLKKQKDVIKNEISFDLKFDPVQSDNVVYGYDDDDTDLFIGSKISKEETKAKENNSQIINDIKEQISKTITITDSKQTQLKCEEQTHEEIKKEEQKKEELKKDDKAMLKESKDNKLEEKKNSAETAQAIINTEPKKDAPIIIKEETKRQNLSTNAKPFVPPSQSHAIPTYTPVNVVYYVPTGYTYPQYYNPVMSYPYTAYPQYTVPKSDK